MTTPQKSDEQPRDVCEDVLAGVAHIRNCSDAVPEVALILGSGLGKLAESLEESIAIDSTDIPGYPASTVDGHHGRVVLGRLEGRNVVVIQGRLHFYEGHSMRGITFPVRLVHGLGARRLIVTNAAGGINPLFRTGSIMFIVDHMNMTFQGPLVGPNTDAGPRFPDMSEPYDADWTARAERCALDLGLRTRRGVYLWTPGPSYESRAEIRFFARIGADAVGMSTVPETIQARYLGMRVLGISTITNPAAGLAAGPLNHDEVLTVGEEVRTELEALLRAIIRVT